MQAQDMEFQTDVCIISSLTEAMNNSFFLVHDSDGDHAGEF
jgi:hypothetical protein